MMVSLVYRKLIDYVKLTQASTRYQSILRIYLIDNALSEIYLVLHNTYHFDNVKHRIS